MLMQCIIPGSKHSLNYADCLTTLYYNVVVLFNRYCYMKTASTFALKQKFFLPEQKEKYLSTFFCLGIIAE